jgi:uncharacterized protein (TIGR02145 family)
LQLQFQKYPDMKRRISFSEILPGILVVILMSCSEKDSPPGPVTDIEGNTYRTEMIGGRVWMAENLMTSTFSDGTEIPDVTGAVGWNELTTPGRCWYDNDATANKESYGALYNYYSVNSGKLCPDGWHVPSRDEWEQFRDVLGDTLTGGGKLKEEGTLHWRTPNTGATNSMGFTALPAGIRYFEGTFNSVTFFTSFWSSTESDNNKAWYLSLYYNDAVAAMNRISKKDGFSVRCVKN